MSREIKNINGMIIFSHLDDEYELRSHPYEPCLYIYKDDDLWCERGALDGVKH